MILVKNYRQIHDIIHGYIKLSNIACEIIDTIEFQRLRYLRQLGTCFYVFPTGLHSRFEHSLGTYHLASKLLDNIRINNKSDYLNSCLENIDELKDYFNRSCEGIPKLDDFICELVKIAGLCHDLGHGPFSHIFDDVFIPSVVNKENENNPSNTHEYRSGKILEHIIYNNPNLKELIQDQEIQFIKNLINPKPDHFGFIYQIISNNFNSIDVDKYDYLARDAHMLGLKFGFDSSRMIDNALVINNIICFPEQIYYEVASIFTTRYRLHKQIYTHKMVIATQFMICEIMKLLEPVLHIYDSINNITDFCMLTDDYIFSIIRLLYKTRDKYNDNDTKLIESAYDIWYRINTRKLYRFVTTVVSNKQIDEELDDTFRSDLSINNIIDDVVIYKSHIGFVSGKKNNPFKNMYFYRNKDINTCFKIETEKITYLMPTIYQEYIYTIFLKTRDSVDIETKIKQLTSQL